MLNLLQILQKLPPSYQSIIDVITHSKPFPSFLEAKNMPDSVEVRHIFKRANQRDFASVQAAAIELDSLRKK